MALRRGLLWASALLILACNAVASREVLLEHAKLGKQAAVDGASRQRELQVTLTNLALNKPAYASSVYTAPDGNVYRPSLAVDGDKTNFRDANGAVKFFRTGGDEPYPWLSIDLGTSCRVSRIVLYNRIDCCGERLQNAEVRVGNTPILTTRNTSSIKGNALVWKQTAPVRSAASVTITLSTPVVGRWVTLQNFNYDTSKYDNHFLHLQEVEVFGVPPPAPPPPPKTWRNLALGRPAYSSSKYAMGSYGPEFAVDGDKTTVRLPNGDYKLFHTGGTEPNPWLSIDLGSPFIVTRVMLYNRIDCCGERLQNAELRVGNTPITTISDTNSIPRNILVWKQTATIMTNTVFTITVKNPAVGRWVTLQNFNYDTSLIENRFLNLQEVEVYGFVPPS